MVENQTAGALPSVLAWIIQTYLLYLWQLVWHGVGYEVISYQPIDG